MKLVEWVDQDVYPDLWEVVNNDDNAADFDVVRLQMRVPTLVHAKDKFCAYSCFCAVIDGVLLGSSKKAVTILPVVGYLNRPDGTTMTHHLVPAVTKIAPDEVRKVLWDWKD